MATGGIWAKIHKWLALLIAIQILLWFMSGLFFAIFPIEKVRSEHVMARQPAVPLDVAAAGFARLAAARVASGETVTLRMVAGRPAALIANREGRPRLYDLATGRPLSPVPMTLAARIAEADHAGDARAARVTLVTAHSGEYRGPVPAWRVDFDDGAERSLYVVAASGEVKARRSRLWRIYDFLWRLHIMDWTGEEDFSTPLLVAASLLALIMSIAGIVLLPSRLGFTAWLRRRRVSRSASG